MISENAYAVLCKLRDAPDLKMSKDDFNQLARKYKNANLGGELKRQSLIADANTSADFWLDGWRITDAGLAAIEEREAAQKEEARAASNEKRSKRAEWMAFIALVISALALWRAW